MFTSSAALQCRLRAAAGLRRVGRHGEVGCVATQVGSQLGRGWAAAEEGLQLITGVLQLAIGI